MVKPKRKKIKKRPPRLFQDKKGRIYVIINKKKIEIKTKSKSDDYTKRELLDIILKQKRVKRRRRKPKTETKTNSFNELENSNRNQKTKLADAVVLGKAISQALVPLKDVNQETRDKLKIKMLEQKAKEAKTTALVPITPKLPSPIKLPPFSLTRSEKKGRVVKRVFKGRTIFLKPDDAKDFDMMIQERKEEKKQIEEAKKLEKINKTLIAEQEKKLLQNAENDMKRAEINRLAKFFNINLKQSNKNKLNELRVILTEDEYIDFIMSNGENIPSQKRISELTSAEEFGTPPKGTVMHLLEPFTTTGKTREGKTDEYTDDLSPIRQLDFLSEANQFLDDTLEEIKKEKDEKEEQEEQEASGKRKGGLFTSQIDKIMKPWRKKGYIGTYAIDQIKNLDPGRHKKFGFVMNLDKSSKPGSHWVAVFVDTKHDMSVEYYDSFGEEPPKEFLKNIKILIDRLGINVYLKMKINRIVQQHANSKNCGWFALRFLMHRFDGKDWKFCSGYKDLDEKAINKFKKKFDFI